MEIKLQEGEEILFKGTAEEKIFTMWIFTKVIPVCLIVAFIIFQLTLVFGGLFFCSVRGQKEPPFYLLPPLFIFLIHLTFILAMAYYQRLKETYKYYVTNQRCIFEGGIVVRRLRNVPFYKITDVEINQNIIERMLGIFSLKIFTAGTASLGSPGFERAEIVFWGLKDAETPAGIIQGILRKYKATGE